MSTDKENNRAEGNRSTKFSSLLASAQSTLRADQDSSMAQSIQKKDFLDMSSQWVQEIVDKKVFSAA